jgi:YHS domain-containing protein
MNTATPRHRIATALLLALIAPLAVARSSAQEEKRDVSQFNLDEKGVALSGYDPVAYFEEGGGKAAKGKADLALTHRGVTYRFSSAANRELFEKEPARYEPDYGGWCAYAMASGEKVEIDPKSFLVTDGVLTVY